MLHVSCCTFVLLLFKAGKELGPDRFRGFYANRSSEPNSPFFLGKNDLNSVEREILYEPLLAAMAQVLPFQNQLEKITLRVLDLDVYFCHRKTREGRKCRFLKAPLTAGGDKVQSGVDPRFAAGLPFRVPKKISAGH